VTENEVNFDFDRPNRIGLSEAVLCEGKSVAQIEHIVSLSVDRGEALLLTRLDGGTYDELSEKFRSAIDFDPVSRTGIVGDPGIPAGAASVAVVAAGSTDIAIAREVSRTLGFYGESADEFIDIGVAGLWRVLERQEQLREYSVVIVVAGMDGALFSVLGGLVAGVVIAVPTATGYGTSNGGTTALHAALASCAPGVVAVNIGNGYGAACAALRALRAGRK
jgi:NCAIR mutase (PurE)-related protein